MSEQSNEIQNKEKKTESKKKSKIISKSITHKKKKKIKIRAWCGDCYQFFENGPFSKVCKTHLNKGKCNLVGCTKQLITKIECKRKFPNINSENRHTHCIGEDDLSSWDINYNLQNCLGNKRSSDKYYEKQGKILLNNKTTKIEENVNEENENLKKEKSNEFENLNFDLAVNYTNNNCNYVSLIDEINNLNFFEGEKYTLDDNLIKDFGNFNFNTSPLKIQNIINEKENSEEEKNSPIQFINDDIKKEKSKICLEESKSSVCFEDDDSIENIFDKVYLATNIPKNILNKLKNAFKKKGIFNGKVLKLFIKKKEIWNLFVQEFKKTCSEIEGVALYLENSLDK